MAAALDCTTEPVRDDTLPPLTDFWILDSDY
jgi:hypothetical protein